MFLPKNILEHGFDGEIQRLTLLRMLEMSPGSSETRSLISGSYRYGLTEGSYSAPSLSVTDNGRLISESDSSSLQFKTNVFELAIKQFDPFNQLYDKLKEGRLREGKVLQDGLGLDEFSEADRSNAANVFTANLRFIGLIQDVAGSEHVRDIERIVQATQTETTNPTTESTDREAKRADTSLTPGEVAIRLLTRDVIEALDDIPPRMRMVLALRLGLIDDRSRTLEEIGRELGVTRERVRHIEKQALTQLRNSGRLEKVLTWLRCARWRRST